MVLSSLVSLDVDMTGYWEKESEVEEQYGRIQWTSVITVCNIKKTLYNVVNRKNRLTQ